MAIRHYGGFITKDVVAPTSSIAKGVWTLEEALQARAAGNWPAYVAPPTLAYTVGSGNLYTDTSYSSGWSFTMDLGAETVADKLVVIVAGMRTAADGATLLNSITVAGNAATVISTAQINQGNRAYAVIGYYEFTGGGPHPTSGTVVVTRSGSGTLIGAWAGSVIITGHTSATPHDSDEVRATSASSTVVSGGIDVPAGSICITDAQYNDASGSDRSFSLGIIDNTSGGAISGAVVGGSFSDATYTWDATNGMVESSTDTAAQTTGSDWQAIVGASWG